MPTTSTGLSLFFIPFALFGLLIYGLIFFCVWKFYQMLSKINNNIASINANLIGIRISGMGTPERVAGPPSSRIRQCPFCGLTVLPTGEGRCPSCQKPMGSL